MIKTSTKNELVKYLYKESTSSENTNINMSKLTDQEFEDELLSLDSMRQQLDTFALNASQKTLDRILTYSKEYDNE